MKWYINNNGVDMNNVDSKVVDTWGTKSRASVFNLGFAKCKRSALLVALWCSALAGIHANIANAQQNTLPGNSPSVQEAYLALKADFAELRENNQPTVLEMNVNTVKVEDNHTRKSAERKERGVVVAEELAAPTMRILAGFNRTHAAQAHQHIEQNLGWEKTKRKIARDKVHVHRILERQQLVSMDVDEAQLDALVNDDSIDFLSRDSISFVSLEQSVAFIGGTSLHTTGYSGHNQAVAILDTGVDNAHPFIGSRIVEQACFSSGNGTTAISLCPNGESRFVGEGAADDCADLYPTNDCRHGTHVAGIAAGWNLVFSGVAPSANIVAVQVFTYFPSTGRLGAYVSDQVAALDWLLNEAQTPNIVSANMSLGSGDYSNACDTYFPQAPLIQALRDAGTATVIASGNNGYNGFVNAPGCIASAVTVGSTVKDSNTMSSFSNSASLVDLVAPGSSIRSSAPNGQYMWMSGTSMATPHVAGAFAVLKAAVPKASVDEIEQALKHTGVAVADSAANVSLPRIDLPAALAYLQEPASTPLPDPDPLHACLPAPGPVIAHAGEIPAGQSKTWQLATPSGGLHRMYLDSVAVGSQGLSVSVGDYEVGVSVIAGTSIIDFPEVPAGMTELRISAQSDGVHIGAVALEQLLSNGSQSGDTCLPPEHPVPGMVTSSVGELVVSEPKRWSLYHVAQGNLRISLMSTSALNSREVKVSMNGIDVNVSMNPGVPTYIDFANVAAGELTLTIEAVNEQVELGGLHLLAY